jgi:hypothetical protein
MLFGHGYQKLFSVGIDIRKLAVKDAVITFDGMAVCRIKVVEGLGMPIGENTKNIL